MPRALALRLISKTWTWMDAVWTWQWCCLCVCVQRSRTGGGAILHHPRVQGEKNHGNTACALFVTWAVNITVSVQSHSCLCLSVCVCCGVAGLWDPSWSGGDGRSAVHRPDWSGWDRPAAHQPVSSESLICHHHERWTHTNQLFQPLFIYVPVHPLANVKSTL